MNDFSAEVLSNGIKVHRNPIDAKFTGVYLMVPLGTAHNTGLIKPGAFHFLEHMCCTESELYPEANSYARKVGLTGGWENAATSTFDTVYQLSAPNDSLSDLLPGFFARVFRPVFSDQALANQRTVIANERQRRQRWYPGSSEISWYESTQWQYDMRFPLNQIFGADDDLAAMDAQSLRLAHRQYFASGIRLFIAGSADVQPLISELEGLSVIESEAASSYDVPRWVRQDYHVKHFRDASRYSLNVSGFDLRDMDIVTERQVRFMLGLLTNTTTGVLYDWLRNELGWSYGVRSWFSSHVTGCGWDLEFPVNSLSQVEVVRREWRDRARASLQDGNLIATETKRMLGSTAYWNSDQQRIIDGAVGEVRRYGNPVSDDEWRDYLEQCNNPKAILELFDKLLCSNLTAEYCSAPE